MTTAKELHHQVEQVKKTVEKANKALKEAINSINALNHSASAASKGSAKGVMFVEIPVQISEDLKHARSVVKKAHKVLSSDEVILFQDFSNWLVKLPSGALCFNPNSVPPNSLVIVGDTKTKRVPNEEHGSMN